MKTSERYAVISSLIGLFFGVLATMWFGWIAGVIVGLVLAGAFYNGLLKQKALENVANLKPDQGK